MTLRRSSSGAPKAGGGSDRVWFAQWLRGFAVILVLSEHMVFAFWANNAGQATFAHTEPLPPDVAQSDHLGPLMDLVRHDIVLGNVAVGLFFLVSGFVIPMSLERYSPGRFAVARVFRLYPVWLVSLGVAAISMAIYAIAVGNPFPYDLGTWVKNTTLLQDWDFTSYINPPVWTLLVEVKFYLLCGLLAWWFGLTKPIPILGLLSGMLVFNAVMEPRIPDILMAGHTQWAIVVHTIVFTGKFVSFMFLGVCFYNLYRRKWSLGRFAVVTTLVAGLFATFVLQGQDAWVWKRQVLYAFGAALLVWGVAYMAPRLVPKGRFWNFMANISYPLYTTHYILGAILMTAFYHLHPDPLLNVLEALAVIVPLSWLIHHFVEMPSMRYGKRVRIKPGTLERLWPRRRAPEEPAPALLESVALVDGPRAAVETTVAEPSGPRPA